MLGTGTDPSILELFLRYLIKNDAVIEPVWLDEGICMVLNQGTSS